MQNLVYVYDLWRRTGAGAIVVQYLVMGEATETYQFPTLKKMFAKANELFLVTEQVPKKIIVEDWCIKFVFAPKTFPTKKDKIVRDKFFQWVIDHSKKVS